MSDNLSKEQDAILLQAHHIVDMHKQLEVAFVTLQQSIDDFNGCRQKLADRGEMTPEKVSMVSKVNITGFQISFNTDGSKSVDFDTSTRGLEINV